MPLLLKVASQQPATPSSSLNQARPISGGNRNARAILYPCHKTNQARSSAGSAPLHPSAINFWPQHCPLRPTTAKNCCRKQNGLISASITGLAITRRQQYSHECLLGIHHGLSNDIKMKSVNRSQGSLLERSAVRIMYYGSSLSRWACPPTNHRRSSGCLGLVSHQYAQESQDG